MKNYGLKSEKAAKLVDDLKQNITKLGGSYSWDADEHGNKLMFLIYLNTLVVPVTGSNCVATIDWMTEKRYGEQRTFNVCTYNENFSFDKQDCQRYIALQKLVVKYSRKLWETENG